jgi:RHS repeat-associated protein
VGWADNLNMSLSIGSGTATVTDENGAQIVFDEGASSNSWCLTGYNYCPAAPRTIATLNEKEDGSWTFTRDIAGQQTFSFSSAGVLTNIADTAGGTTSDSLSALFDEAAGTGHCPTGTDTCTQWTASATGDTLTLQNSGTEIVAVYSYSGSTLSEESTFCYYGQSCAPGSGGNSGQLYSVTDPGGLTYIYAYDTSNASTSECTPSGTSCYEDDVVSVTGPTPGAVLTNCYYGDSPCAADTGGSEGQVYSQTDPAGQVTEFAYSGNPASETGSTTTVTTYPQGTSGSSDQEVYTYAYGEIQGEASGTGSGAETELSVPDPASGLAETIVDGDSNTTNNTFASFETSGSYLTGDDEMATIDGVGNESVTAFTPVNASSGVSLNEPYCQIDAADVANGVTCPTMTTIASGSGGSSLPQSTIDVASTTGFVASSPLAVPTTAGIQSVTCTGSTSTTFTGCSGGSGTMSSGWSVIQAATAPTRGSDPWPGATITFYDAAGNAIFNVTARGGVSQTAYTAASGGVPELAYCTVDAVEYGGDDVTCPSMPPTTPPTSATGFTTTIYSSTGNITSSTTPTDATTTYSDGDPAFPTEATVVTDPDGTVTTNSYDAAGRLTQAVQSFGSYSATTITAFDPAGNVYCTIEPIPYSQGDTACPVVTSIGSSSAGISLPQSTIYVGSTTGFAELSPLAIPTSLGIQSVTCTGETSNTFTGCTGGSGTMSGGQSVLQVLTASTTVTSGSNGAVLDPNTTIAAGSNGATLPDTNIAAGSNGASLPQATINVVSTTGFTTSSSISVDTTAGIQSVSCTGDTSTTFTGCSGGSGTMSTGGGVSQLTTIDVGSTSGFATAAAMSVQTSAGNKQYVTCSGETATSFTGCSDGSGTLATGDAVSQFTTSPTRGGDPWPGVTITFFDADSNPIYEVNPLGGVTQTAYNAAGAVFCTVAPLAYDPVSGSGVNCPTSEPTTTSSPPIPTPGSDDFLGRTITTHNSLGQVTQVTNPLGGITTTSYDSAGNVHETQVESGASGQPTVTTVYTYNGDNQVLDTTVGTTTTETTVNAYDPDGDVYCSISANNYANGYTCPAWTASWIVTPPLPSTIVSSNPHVTTSFYDADGDLQQSTDPDGQTTVNAYDADGHTYCTSDPTNADAWMSAHSSTPYPYLCPSTVPTSAPTGTTTDYITTIYDADGNTLSTTDQLGETTTYNYDAGGDKTEMTDPDGQSTTYCYYGGQGAGTCPGAAQKAGFSAASNIDGTALNAVACTSPNACIGVANNGHAASFNGARWSGFADVDGTKAINAVSCVSSTGCYAVDNHGQEIPYSESGWGVPTTIDSTTALNAISCTATSYCVAVDNNGNEVTSDEGAWSASSLIDSGNALEGVSCVSAAFCMAVDNAGNYVEDNGGWGSATSFDPGHALEAVSCVSAVFCMATDNHGNVLQWGAAGWTGPTSIDGTNSINSVSCLTISFCVAVDANGAALVWNGSSWAKTSSVDGSRSINSVSCSNTYFCAALGAGGYAVTFEGTGSADDLLSQTTPPTTVDTAGDPTYYTYAPGGAANVTTTKAGMTTDDYDVNGDLVTQAEANAGSAYNATPTVDYGYWWDGTRSSMADGNGITQYTPDENGDVLTAQFSSDSSMPSSSVSYSYYSTGAPDTVTYPSYGNYVSGTSSSPTVTYTYDSFGNMATAADWLGNTVSLCYDDDNNLLTQANDATSCTSPGTNSSTFSYDPADETTGVSSKLSCSSAGLTQSFSSRNADGQIKEDTQTFNSGCSSTSPGSLYYNYDVAGRVDYEGTAASTSTNFGYSSAGEPTTFSTLSGSTTDTYTDTFDESDEGAQITEQAPNTGFGGATSTYTYDNVGDQITDASGSTTTTYGYDQTGQMVSDSVGSTTEADYAYTGDGLEAMAQPVPARAGWSAVTATGDSNPVESVSCPTASFCMAVDNDGLYLTYNGSTWSTATPITTSYGSHVVESVSCVSLSDCVAVDNDGNGMNWNGSGWTVESGMDSTRVINAVSCATANFCMAVDNTGRTIIWGGSSWGSPSTVVDSNPLLSVSCSASNFCMAVDNGGEFVIYSGGSGTGWNSAAYLDDGTGHHPLESVSCPSSSYCAAVDNNGNANTYNGSGWQGYALADSAFATVSCPSAAMCTAVTTGGKVTTLTGSSWSALTTVDAANTPEAISCPSEAFCVFVDNAGKYETYNGSFLTWDTNSSLPTVLTDGSNDYIYGPNDEPIEEINLTTSAPSSVPTYMTYTPEDSSWLLTDESGDLTGFTDYDAFGTSLYSTGATSPFGYAGQYQGTSSNVSGFDNMRARWYDAETGSFTTSDPEFDSTDQAYTYAGDDPVNESDPSGLAWCDFLPAGCGSLPGGRPGSPNGTNINYTPQGSETGEQYWAKLFCESPVGFEGKPFICGSQLNPNQGPIETEGLNRGRFQAQGGGVEESVSWSSHIVPTVSDGLQMLADLGQSLSASQFAARVGALAKATTYVRDVCAPSGGCPPLSKSFYSNGSAQQKGIRIDLEIFTGIAFIPDIVNPAQTAAYVTSSECGTVA